MMNPLDTEKTSSKLGLNQMMICLWVKALNIVDIIIIVASVLEKMVNIIYNFFLT